MISRDSIMRLLLRRPGTTGSPVARWAATAAALAGAAMLIWSAWIHIMLWWSDGYKDIHIIGPLFLAQGIACIVLAVPLVIWRSVAVQAVSAVTLAATAAGLLISVNYGLFGLKESLAVPYTVLSLYEEFGGAAILIAGSVILAVASPAVKPQTNPSRSPSRT
jgi:hypothetical protein